MESHSVKCHPEEVWIPPLPPAEAGTRFSNPVGIQGWVDLCYVKADRLGIEPATSKSQVQCPSTTPIYICVRSTLGRIQGTNGKRLMTGRPDAVDLGMGSEALSIHRITSSETCASSIFLCRCCKDPPWCLKNVDPQKLSLQSWLIRWTSSVLHLLTDPRRKGCHLYYVG